MGKKKKSSPLEQLLFSAAESVLKLENAKDLDSKEIVEAITEGIKSKIEEIEYGLYVLNPQEETMLHVFKYALANKPPGTKLKLIAEPERNEAGLVGADGKPMTKDTPSILAPK